jgi:predicted dehydrogenase
MIKVGLLSAAHMHVGSYAHQLNQLPKVQITGLWDDNAKRREECANAFGCPAAESAASVIAASDALVICSENINHRPLLEQVLQAGTPKFVLCEKPLATTAADARVMVDATIAGGSSLFTAFPCRFSPAFQRLVSVVRNGDLGEILAVRGTNHGKCPFGWFVEKALSGGGAVMDHTVHVTDLLRVLLQTECATVFCEADNRMLHRDFDDTGFLALGFENGVFATLDASWSRPKTFTTWGDVTLSVVGTKGFIDLDMFNQQSLLYNDRTGSVSYSGWGSDIDGGLIRAFVQSLETGEPHPEIATGVDGLRAVEVVEAAYRSVGSHQVEAVVHL